MDGASDIEMRAAKCEDGDGRRRDARGEKERSYRAETRQKMKRDDEYLRGEAKRGRGEEEGNEESGRQGETGR